VRIGHRRRLTKSSTGDALDDRRADLLLGDIRHRLVFDRQTLTATFEGPPLSPDELLHPFLVPVASIAGRWLGREAFHGGAVAFPGGALALLGPREAGKSTLLAALAGAGLPVLADDMVVIEHGRVFRGPPCVDLRCAPPAGVLDGLPLARVRRGSRFRVRLPESPLSVPLRGWVFLESGRRVALRSLDPRERLSRLARWRSWPALASDPAAFLDLAALPVWGLARPRRWSALAATIKVLRQAAEDSLPRGCD
jgi:energy-coupling factor transporter ATP-binding protein EcfA2